MKYTDILWDYNGTILDDVEIGIAATNVLLRKRNLKTIDSVEAYHSVFGFPVIDYYARLGFDFDKESFDAISIEWVEEYSARFPMCQLRHGVLEVIERIARTELRQSIISASDDSMLKEQLLSLGINSYFDGIYGIEGVKAESKTHIAREWRRKNPDAKALFIGDTLHDLDAANAAGADCVLVCGGHQSKQALLRAGVPVVENVNGVFAYF